MRALALQGPDLSKWFGGQGRTLRDPDAAPVLGLSPPRALLIALAHLVNLGTPPAPGPYLLSHQTDPGDPILSFPSNISIRGGRGRQGQGQGQGKGKGRHRAYERRGTRARLPEVRKEDVSIFASPASGGRSARKGQGSGAWRTRARTSSFDEDEDDHHGS